MRISDWSSDVCSSDLGDEAMNVQALSNSGAVAALNRATEQWETMKKDLDAILGSSQRLFAAQNAAAALTSGSDKLLSDSRDLFQAFTAFGSLRDKSLLGNLWIKIGRAHVRTPVT